ncbi:MAG: response regulator [Desulfuromonadales bacterium]|nr:response regulator [Desulfuromonadales bacterium]
MNQAAMPEESIKILLVDDEVNITKALRRLLMEDERYDIYIAHSGPEGLAQIVAEPGIGVIISDQRMPEMTGVEFLQQAREMTPDAVRILLTGYADIEASIAAINQGAVFRYLTKPWQDDELLQVVAGAARGFWLVAENKRLNALVAKQNKELQDWNSRLKQRVLDQTSQIRAKSDALAISHQQLRGSFNETIEAFAGLIEMRDRRAPGHSRNVAELVTAMAVKLNIPKEERDKYRSAGLLHDIGKIGMSDSLIVKSVKNLEEKELKEYQSHVVRGQAAIDMVPALRDIGVLIRHHHERFDGRGFPEKLKADAIPFGARLICAADMFERLLLQYPEADALDSAIDELAQQWGKALDPALRSPLEEGAHEVYSHLDISAEIFEIKVSPKELEVGMQLRYDLHSGTGVLMLKQGTIFDEAAIEAVRRCLMVDPFEREISVLIDRSKLGKIE